MTIEGRDGTGRGADRSGIDREGSTARTGSAQDATRGVYGVKACRGHWHVCVDPDGDWEDIALPGDPFPTYEAALAALDAMLERDALKEMEAMAEAGSVAGAEAFFAFEASLAAAEMFCPHCGQRVNATDSPPPASVPAVDPSRSTPQVGEPSPDSAALRREAVEGFAAHLATFGTVIQREKVSSIAQAYLSALPPSGDTR